MGVTTLTLFSRGIDTWDTTLFHHLTFSVVSLQLKKRNRERLSYMADYLLVLNFRRCIVVRSLWESRIARHLHRGCATWTKTRAKNKNKNNSNNNTRKQNLQANSRPACQFLAQKREGSTDVAKFHIPSLLQGVEIELIFALSCVYGPQFDILADF